jgi:hypothetical protein
MSSQTAENITKMHELRDAKVTAHLEQYAPIWLVGETVDGDVLQFNVVFYHPYYGWVNRRYRFDAFNNVLYHQGQTKVSDEAADVLIDKKPYLAAETVNTVDSYGG